MMLGQADVTKQVQHMISFIEAEAKQKAEEIEARAIEDFNIEKLKLVQQKKDQVRNEFRKKAKQLETQKAIARSTAINRARLKKIAARNQVVEEVSHLTNLKLAELPTKTYERLCVDLVTQALLMLLEEEAYVRIRKEDEEIMDNIIRAASKQYSEIVKDQTGVGLSVKCKIDRDHFLPPAPTGNKERDTGRTCAGGVIVTTMDRKITVDNTLDARLNIVMKDCLPGMRKILFPTA